MGRAVKTCTLRSVVLFLASLLSCLFVSSYSANESIIKQFLEFERLERNPIGLTRFFRRDVPSSYTVSVGGYSAIASTHSVYESAVFDSVGYKWRMIIYPMGKASDGGSDHISLYVRIEDTESLPENWKVDVELKMFVMNVYKNKYLGVQDGMKRSYNDADREWGIAQVIPLDVFKRKGNGYLEMDMCTFGTEIALLGQLRKSELLNFQRNPRNNTLTWKIRNFSQLNEAKFYYSDDILVQGRYWRLGFNPKSGRDEQNQTQAILIFAEGYSQGAVVASTFSMTRLRLVNQRGMKHIDRNAGGKFYSVSPGSSLATYFSLQDLYNETKGFLVKDSITIEATMLYVSNTGIYPPLNSISLEASALNN